MLLFFFWKTSGFYLEQKCSLVNINSAEAASLWQGYGNTTSCCQRAFARPPFLLRSFSWTSWSSVSQPAVKRQAAGGDQSSNCDCASLWFLLRPHSGVDNWCLPVLIRPCLNDEVNIENESLLRRPGIK